MQGRIFRLLREHATIDGEAANPPSLVDAAFAHLFDAGPDSCRVYAVLDGARDERIHRAVARSGAERLCLYAGELAPAIAPVAPYLVQLGRDYHIARPLLAHGWGQSWGIFVRAATDIATLHRHLRRLLRVRTEDGRTMLFRFYDPRVLRRYLPTCTSDELAEMFGPIRSFVTEDRAPTRALDFTRAGASLETRSTSLEARAVAVALEPRATTSDPRPAAIEPRAGPAIEPRATLHDSAR